MIRLFLLGLILLSGNLLSLQAQQVTRLEIRLKHHDFTPYADTSQMLVAETGEELQLIYTPTAKDMLALKQLNRVRSEILHSKDSVVKVTNTLDSTRWKSRIRRKQLDALLTNSQQNRELAPKARVWDLPYYIQVIITTPDSIISLQRAPVISSYLEYWKVNNRPVFNPRLDAFFSDLLDKALWGQQQLVQLSRIPPAPNHQAELKALAEDFLEVVKTGDSTRLHAFFFRHYVNFSDIAYIRDRGLMPLRKLPEMLDPPRKLLEAKLNRQVQSSITKFNPHAPFSLLEPLDLEKLKLDSLQLEYNLFPTRHLRDKMSEEVTQYPKHVGELGKIGFLITDGEHSLWVELKQLIFLQDRWVSMRSVSLKAGTDNAQ